MSPAGSAAITLCLAVGMGLTTAHSDAVQGAGPRARAAEYLAAVDAGEWDKAAGFIESGDAVTFRQMTLTVLLFRMSRADSTRTGAFSSADPATALRNGYGAMRVAPLRDRATVADILALSPRELLAGGLEATHARFHTAPSRGVAVRVHRDIRDVRLLDESTARVRYTMRAAPESITMSSDLMELPLRKHANRWYVMPTGELASPMQLVGYLTESM